MYIAVGTTYKAWTLRWLHIYMCVCQQQHTDVVSESLHMMAPPPSELCNRTALLQKEVKERK